MYKEIRGTLAKQKDKFYYFLALRRPRGKKAFLLGTPLHRNLGDSAITLAHIAFLRQCGYAEPKEINFIDSSGYYRATIRKAIWKHDILSLLGGGNMGDQWFSEELFRRTVLKDFPRRKILIFPQTIYYTNTENGREERAASVAYYNDPRITLVARERPSYDEMRRLYPKANVLLTPDIVLSLPMQRFDTKREGILLCLRSDAEKSLGKAEEDSIKRVAEATGLTVTRTDMMSEEPITMENRSAVVTKKLRSFSSSKLVITDRLHGMIFAAITGTPCIVFSNYNHKVCGTYEWLSYLPYIKFVQSVKDASAVLPELLHMENCVYDNTPLKPYFDQLANMLQGQ